MENFHAIVIKNFNDCNCNILQIESISTKLHGSEAPNVLWSTFCDSTAGSLTTLELEDVSIDGKKGLFTAPRKTRCSFKACALEFCQKLTFFFIPTPLPSLKAHPFKEMRYPMKISTDPFFSVHLNTSS